MRPGSFTVPLAHRWLTDASLVALAKSLVHAVRPEHDADVDGVELVVNHRAVADQTSGANVALYERRQGSHRGALVDCLARHQIHVDIAPGARLAEQKGTSSTVFSQITLGG